MSADQDTGLGITRWRDLLVVAVVAAVVVKLLLVWNYQRIPTLPLAAGVPAALIGLGEIAVGIGLRRRIADWVRDRHELVVDPAARRPRTFDPLTVARTLAVAKATALAGAAVVGIWVGVVIHVVPIADEVAAAANDRTSALLGGACAVLMTGGALFLEHCCRTPGEPGVDAGGRYSSQT